MSLEKFATHSHDEWLALRHQYIGGSDAAAVVGLNQYASAYSVWAEKTNRVPGFEGNLATEVGTYLEEFVAKKFAEVSGKKVRRCNLSMVNSDYPWAIANVDRLIVGEDAGLEIKTTSDLCIGKFKNGEYPSNYYVQSMHYMAVTGKARWYLAVLIGNHELKTYTIERDEDEIAALMQAEKEFWECVQNDTPPAADGSEATSKTLGRLYPDSTEDAVDIGHMDGLMAGYFALKEQKKELDEKLAAIENRVKEFMGSSGYGKSEKYSVSWKASDRHTVDTKKLFKDYPSINPDDYTKTTTSRRFLAKQKG